MAEDLLGNLSKADIRVFHSDFAQLFRVSKEMDRYYGRWHSDIDNYYPKYARWLDRYGKKYKGIKIVAVKRIDVLETKLLLKDASIQAVFEHAVSKVPGLKSLGATNFTSVDASNAIAVMAEVKRAQRQLLITYYDPATGTRTTYLSFDDAEKMPRLHFQSIRLSYEIDEISYDASPDFKIACFYALREGVDSSIDLFREGATFGFDDVLSEREKAEFYHKMPMRYHE